MNQQDKREVEEIVRENSPGCLFIVVAVAFIFFAVTLSLESYFRIRTLESRLNVIENQHSITNQTLFPENPFRMIFRKKS